MIDKQLDKLVFKSFEDVSTSVSKYRGVTFDNRIVCISFIEGSCEIGIGKDLTEALRSRREIFTLSDGGDHISKAKLFEIMGWSIN